MLLILKKRFSDKNVDMWCFKGKKVIGSFSSLFAPPILFRTIFGRG